MNKIDYEDMDYTITYEIIPSVIKFNVYKHCKTDQGIFYQNKESSSGPDLAEFEKAEIYISGSVKWDGCSNWDFEPDSETLVHFCGLDDAEEMLELFKRMYAIAKTELE